MEEEGGRFTCFGKRRVRSSSLVNKKHSEGLDSEPSHLHLVQARVGGRGKSVGRGKGESG